MAAYREMSDDDLLTTQWVKVDLPPEEFPGYKGERIACEVCGEGIRREVLRDGEALCPVVLAKTTTLPQAETYPSSAHTRERSEDCPFIEMLAQYL